MSNVCIVSARFYPQAVGSATAAYSVACELFQRGHEVTVITDGELEKAHKEHPFPFNVRYVHGIEKYATGEMSMQAPCAELFKIIHDVDPDLLHVCNFMPMLLVTIGSTLLKCPVMFTPYNTPLKNVRSIGYFEDQQLDLALARFILEAGAYNRLVSGSQAYLDAVIDLGADKSKTYLSYLGISPELLLKEPTGRPEDIVYEYFGGKIKVSDRYIILPSRITPQKGILVALKALALIKDLSDVKLVLTGMYSPFSPTYAEKVVSLCDELDIQDRVIFPAKFIPREKIATLLRQSSAVIVPSYYEGLGLAAVEAQMAGVPLIVSDTNGLNEIVSHNVNGLTFEPGNEHELARRILSIFEDPEGVKHLVEDAKITVKKFDITHHIDFLENSYYEMMDSQYV